MNDWQSFYNTIRADSWPDCPSEEQFYLLPDNIKDECVGKFGYVPGSFLIDQQLLDNKAFCILPFVQMYINETNQIALCCYSDSLKENNSSFDFYKDADFEKVRSAMKSGERVKSCNYCYSMEDSGGVSSRMRYTKMWLSKLGSTDINNVEPKLKYYDIRNDNLCNLACRTCRPASSTQLEKEYKKLHWKFKPNSNQTKLSEIVDYDTVEQVYIAGGEPTIMPEFTKFLETAISKGRTDIALTIITNTTNVNKNILALLKRFKNISFTLSLDGYGSVNKYIRWPADWETITKNIETLKTITEDISVNVTVSLYNITRLYELVVFLDDVLPHPPTILLNQSSKGVYWPFNFPNKELAIERLEQLKQTKSYCTESYFANKVDYFINMIKQTEFDKHQLTAFFDYNDTLDHSRGVKLADYIPELEQCRELITKQI